MNTQHEELEETLGMINREIIDELTHVLNGSGYIVIESSVNDKEEESEKVG